MTTFIIFQLILFGTTTITRTISPYEGDNGHIKNKCITIVTSIYQPYNEGLSIVEGEQSIV
jgi:hypothetical protein